MQAENFRLDDYLKRIGFEGAPKADLDSLTRLMQGQVRSVPFENLDVQAGKLVSIKPEDIVAKIVPTTRGGYCYEVNSLFAMALAAIGIPYSIAGARPMSYPTKWARTHMVILAEVEGERYLCDAGYGGLGLRQPLNLATLDTPVQQDRDTYRLIRDGDDYIVQAIISGDKAEWGNAYSFNTSPFDLVDFVPANYYNSTHPDAVFVQKLLLVRHTKTGRHILAGSLLKSFEDGAMTIRSVDKNELPGLVADLFGLQL